MRVEKPLCIGIGEVLWDLLPGGKALGGAPVNVAAHASQLGARGAAVSAIGDDDDGREIIAKLNALQVDVAGIRVRKGLPTGVVDVKLDESGVPAFTIRAPAAWDSIEMDPELERLADAASAVVYGSLAQRDPRSRGGIRRFLEAVTPDCLRVFDINLRKPFYSREIIVSSLKFADVLKLNEDELPELAGMLGLAGDDTHLLHSLLDRFGLELVVFTRGARGSRMISPDEDISHPGCPTAVVDTVGAGDAFTAAVAVGLLRGWELEEIQRVANLLAAFVCSRPGAVPALPREVACAPE